MRKGLFAIIFLFGFQQLVCAQERLAVLPLRGTGVDTSTQETVYWLLVSEIRQSKRYEVIAENEILPLLGGSICSEPACAVDIGRQAKASKVVFGSLNKLGEKIILQYGLVDVSSGATLLSDNMSALHVEDLDQVTKRVAASINQQVPAEKTVEVGTVTEQESQDVKTRKSTASWGIGFGYLYPQKGYDNKDRVFVWDFRSLYEMRHIAVDALLGIRKGFALNVGVLYLPTLKDFGPYAGAAVGFHAVAHEEPYDSYQGDQTDKKRGDGFEFVAKAGILAFRTYDFRVLANVEYSVTLNDYDDGAIVVTIGVMRAGKKVFGIF